MGSDEGRGYRPIRDYALIGDAHTAALVATDGSIDWCCWPHFDSPAVFCRLLDAGKGGFFQIRPVREFRATRAYLGPTAVLTTTFETDDGRVRLTDFMPVERLGESHRGEDIGSSRRILRLLEGLGGEPEIEISFRPTFDYARAEADVTAVEGGAVVRSGDEALVLSCPVGLRLDDAGAARGRLRLRRGERVWVSLSYHADAAPEDLKPSPPAGEEELGRTLNYWEGWWSDCRYEGPYRDLVRRSALTLKLLTFEPTGALVAAPTTSLPEEIGGVRNWDYRFAWLRDSSLIIYALQLLGYEEAAADFFGWLDRLCITCRDHRLQIMYTIGGESHLPEQTLDHLEGYRGSRPVRVGNAAFDQKQLDVYGEVLDAAHLYHERTRQPVLDDWWDELSFMADETVKHWRDPDHGIWEVRGGPRHFLHSKLMCWVALDRAVRLAGSLNGMVYRYLNEDGLPGGEATFAMCSFWLVDNLALQGRRDEARELFERITAYASDTGLFAEEIDPGSGELLGNYPQGFTHLALIRSALHIAKCETHGAEDRAETSAERAGEVEKTGAVSRTSRG